MDGECRVLVNFQYHHLEDYKYDIDIGGLLKDMDELKTELENSNIDEDREEEINTIIDFLEQHIEVDRK
jgi:hypothetical protein